MSLRTDKIKLWHLVFVVATSLLGMGTSWGIAKSQVNNAQTKVVSIEAKLAEANKDIESLKINGAVTNEVLKNIEKKLDAIQRDLDKLNEKIDKLKK